MSLVSLKDIDFGEGRKFNDIDIKFDGDVPVIVQKCEQIISYLKKYPIIPLMAHYDVNKITNERVFIIKDRRTRNRFVMLTTHTIILSRNEKTDIDKLEMIYTKIKNISPYIEALKCGASLVKLLLKSQAYLEKYVDINGKARTGKKIKNKVLIGATLLIVSYIAPEMVLAYAPLLL